MICQQSVSAQTRLWTINNLKSVSTKPVVSVVPSFSEKQHVDELGAADIKKIILLFSRRVHIETNIDEWVSWRRQMTINVHLH